MAEEVVEVGVVAVAVPPPEGVAPLGMTEVEGGVVVVGGTVTCGGTVTLSGGTVGVDGVTLTGVTVDVAVVVDVAVTGGSCTGVVPQAAVA
jgi:hypothetical protein